MFAALFGPPPARADHAPQTLEVNPGEGQRGAIVNVSGKYCEEDGKPFQYASLFVYDGSGQDAFTYYDVAADGSWGGELLIPHTMSGTVTISQSCVADDMVFPGPERKFKILGGPPQVSRSPTQARAGEQLQVSGSGCVTDSGGQLATTAVYMARPVPHQYGHSRPALPTPVSERQVAPDGTWTASFRVPGVEPGDYEVWARCRDDTTVLETPRLPFTITQPPAASTTKPPPAPTATQGAPPSTTSTSTADAAVETPSTLGPEAPGEQAARPTPRRPEEGGGGALLPVLGAVLLALAIGMGVMARRRGLFTRSPPSSAQA